MKKAIFLAVVCLAVCLVTCKKEPDLPDDPHVPLINSFTGVWSVEGEYWQFRTNGTGGRANAEEGPFPDNFSFLIYAGQDVQTAPSEGTLVMLNDSGDADIDVTRYSFSINNNQAVLSEILSQTTTSDSPITLNRVSGAPSTLSLTNSLIGEWSAQWTLSHGDSKTWSLKYRTDGTVKTYHHGINHQFENSYVMRRNILVIFGDQRFGIGMGMGVTAEISAQEDGTWKVSEKHTAPPSLANWVYTKVDVAEWL